MNSSFFSTLFSLGLLAASHLMAETDFESSVADVHVLRSGSLQVEVMDPGAPDAYYQGVRFSPVANVLRANLDGKDFFFAPAEHDPLKENAGLAMEFDISSRKDEPPGFSEAAEGEGFLKVGVGVLKKTGKYYIFSYPYELVERAETEVEWGERTARFRQYSSEVNGYAYELESEVEVQGNTIQIRHCLTNTGSRKLQTENYAHNFFQFDETEIGPGYEVEIPGGDFEAVIKKPFVQQQGRVILFSDFIRPPYKAANVRVEPLEAGRKYDELIVRQFDVGMQIRCLVSTPVYRTMIHAGSRYICPEQFVRFSLSPEESAEWTRIYELSVSD